MKGLVVDIQAGRFVILTKEGDFKTVYANNCQARVGDEIQIPDKQGLSSIFCTTFLRRIAVVAVLFICLSIGGFGLAAYYRPTTFVTLDINPSVEFVANRFERILTVSGLNDSGKALIEDEKQFRNLKLSKGIEILLDQAESHECFTQDNKTVMIAISNQNDKVPNDLKQRLLDVTEEKLKTLDNNVVPNKSQITKATNKKDDIEVFIEATTIENHKKSKRVKISQGRLMLYEELKKANPETTLNKAKNAPVLQLITETKKLKQQKDNKKEMNKNNNQLDNLKIKHNEKSDCKDNCKDNGKAIKESKDKSKIIKGKINNPNKDDGKKYNKFNNDKNGDKKFNQKLDKNKDLNKKGSVGSKTIVEKVKRHLDNNNGKRQQDKNQGRTKHF